MRRGALVLLATPLLLGAASPPSVEETKRLPGFGEVTIYRPRALADARGVVLFVSGDGGWNRGVVDMARRIDDRAIVAGISMPAWQRRAEQHAGSCWYPAGELEVAAQALEKAYGLPGYVAPVLVGYSSGATVAYGAMAQAPPTTFRGAVSLGFCPDLEVKRPVCGTTSWRPGWDDKKRQSWLPETRELAGDEEGGARWIVLQGSIDQVCEPQATAAFVGRVPHSRVIALDKVGHGFSAPSRWGASFDRAVAGLMGPHSLLDPAEHTVRGDSPGGAPDEITAKLQALHLPLEVTWPKGAHAVVIFVSGDGGWADLDRGVAKGLAARGVAVVGWNTLRYFWAAKTPAGFAGDLARVVEALPADAAVFAGGYSFGAETLPVVLGESIEASLSRLRGLTLLAPGPFATFEVSPLDWLRPSGQPTEHPVAAAIGRASRPVLCVAPEDDPASGCPAAGAAHYTRVTVPGGHHFGSDYDALAARIAAFVGMNAPR